MNQPKMSGNDFRTAVDELKNELDMAFLGEMLPARIAADHMTSLFSSMFGGVGALHDHLHLNGPEPEIRASELFTATTQPNDQSIYYFFKQLQSGMPWELPVNQFVAPVAVAFRLFDTLDERFPSPAATDARHVLEHLANLIGCPVERPGLSAKERQLKRERFFGEVHLCETKLRDAFEALSQYFLGLEEPRKDPARATLNAIHKNTMTLADELRMHKEKPASFVTQEKALDVWNRYKSSVEVKAKYCQKKHRVTYADVYDHCKHQLNGIGINSAKAFEKAVLGASRRGKRPTKRQ